LHQACSAAHFLELESFQHFDHGADMADADTGLRPFGERDGCAHFRGNRVRDFIIVCLVGGEDAFHQGEALRRSGAGIAVESTARGRDGAVDILCASHGDHAGHRLGGWIDDLEFLRLGRVDPGAVDIELSIVVSH
jgi:hypothetical protein